MEATATAAAVVPALDVIVKSIKGMTPKTRVNKWTDRADLMIKQIHENKQEIPANAIIYFTNVCEKYMSLRNAYAEMLQNKKYSRLSAWFGDGRSRGNEVIEAAKWTWNEGQSVSNTFYLTSIRCAGKHGKDAPKNADGKCAICCPPGLENLQKVNLPDSHYTAEWFAMNDMMGFTAQTLNQMGDEEANELESIIDSTCAAMTETEDHLPPQYEDHNGSSAGVNASFLPSQVASGERHGDSDWCSILTHHSSELRNDEIHGLLSLISRRRRLITNIPPPEEVNVWESVADFRDRLFGDRYSTEDDRIEPLWPESEP